MGWFRRHLNLTALIIPLLATGLVLLLIQVSFGFYSVNYLSKPNLAIIFANIGAGLVLTITGFGWILRGKKRRLYWLLFFAPLLCPLLLPFVPHHWGMDADMLLVFFTCLIAVAGWIVLLRLRTRRTKNDSPSVEPVRPQGWKSRSRLYQGTLIGVIIAAVAWIGMAGYSGYQWTYGYNSFMILRDNDQPWFTIEVPKSFSSSPLSPIRYYPDSFRTGSENTIRFSMHQQRAIWFTYSEWNSRIEISITNSEIYASIQNQPPELKAWEYVKTNLAEYQRTAYYPVDDIKPSGVTVDGMPAGYASYTIPAIHTKYTNYAPGKISAVYFDRGQYTWVISLYHDNETELSPDPVFERLIRSFDIIEE